MSPESQQSDQNPTLEEKKQEILTAISGSADVKLEVPIPAQESSGPEAPQLVFKEKPILGVVQEPRIDLDREPKVDNGEDEDDELEVPAFIRRKLK